MNKLRIGTAGVPLSAEPRSTKAGIKRLAQLGLGCMELEFVRSVHMKEPTAQDVKATAISEDIELTVHAPYYVNLNSRESDKVAASKKRILKAARIGWIAGAKSITFHAAFNHGDSEDKVYEVVKKELKELREQLNEEGNMIDLRPETTGSPTQFGTVEEIVQLAVELPGVLPCVDFSHLHARSQGAYNTYEEFGDVFKLIEQKLGRQALENLHMHISGIDYGLKGEKKHLILEESDMNYEGVLKALYDFNVGGWLICESPNLEEDALLLQKHYSKLSLTKKSKGEI